MASRIGDLARHTGVYGLGTIVGGLSRAALVPIIARYVPAEEYGKASMILIFITLFTIVSELGLSSSLIKFVNEAPDRARRREVVSTVLATTLLLAVPLAVLCALLAGRLSNLFLGSAAYGSLVLIGVAGGLGNAILQVGLSFERALARSARYVLYTLMKGVLALGLSVILVIAFRKGAYGLLLGAAVPPLLIGAVIYGRLVSRFAIRFSRSVFRNIFTFGSPLVPMNLAIWVLTYSDIYLLRKLSTPTGALTEVGLYQYAHEICLILVLPITSLNLAWPQFLFANHSKPGASETFARVHLYFSYFLLMMAFLLAAFAGGIIGLVGSAQYEGSSGVIPYLAGSLVFYGFSVIFSSGLYVAGRTRILAGVVTGCAVLNVILNILLIPRMGKEGAAAATFATNVVMALTVLAFSQTGYRIPFKLGRTLSGVLLGVAGVAALARWDASGPGQGMLLRVLVSAGFSVALFGLLGLKGRDLKAAITVAGSILRPGSHAGDRPDRVIDI
ncbi:oligosaccharide flippase family protein [Candidatus Eisenbacteria bacterium]|uniref:Oligosaccharide flippase family protein n=1 Tax=Eiseniibacteriota bacterium TaxID=2212470 RepID=A0ABV6YNJ6_UNCEI